MCLKAKEAHGLLRQLLVGHEIDSVFGDAPATRNAVEFLQFRNRLLGPPCGGNRPNCTLRAMHLFCEVDEFAVRRRYRFKSSGMRELLRTRPFNVAEIGTCRSHGCNGSAPVARSDAG